MAKKERTQAKPEQTLTKKVWNMADVLAAAGVGFTDYIIQLTYLLFLKMDSEKESYGLGSALPEGSKWKDIVELDGPDQLAKYEKTCFAEPQYSADNAAGIALLCRRKYLTENI